jgi:hypothetical protein
MPNVPRARRTRLRPVVSITAACVVWAVCVAAQPAPPPPLFRIFLLDGGTVTSYGEYAQVGDKVVFSLPLGDATGTPALHLVTLPSSQVDWAATDRYRDALRAESYAATRGGEDFARMTSQVAAVLNDIALTTDPSAKLALAERARRTLAEWPASHFGYKTDEVRQFLGLLDEVVSELRAARGEQRFDLNLVAGTSVPHVTLLPPPTLQESIAQALALARVAATTEERLSLLQSVAALFDRHQGELATLWGDITRADVARALARERVLSRAYAELRARALSRASRAASRADVRRVERVIRDVRKRDEKLGSARPDDVRALLAALDEQLDAARRLRLARDQWALKAGPLEAFADRVQRPMDELVRARAGLEDIRALAGPQERQLARLEVALVKVTAALGSMLVPEDARPAHGLLLSAAQLAESATRLRRQAVRGGDMKVAWDASAAAAGALMLLDRARADLARAVSPPDFP